jgi:quercetin dioxygenase-like cupin family protein
MSTAEMSEVVLAADEVTDCAARSLGPEAPNVANTVLLEHAGSYAGVLQIPAGQTIPSHQHRSMAHHLWVLHGCARALGRILPQGSYWFVPPGHPHSVEGLPPTGCKLFYVDVPER